MKLIFVQNQMFEFVYMCMLSSQAREAGEIDAEDISPSDSDVSDDDDDDDGDLPREHVQCAPS